MIRYLRLRNYRLHADTELHFDDDRQLILVAGPNGVGKTSLLEAITFALFGEHRGGRAGVDRVLRRGAEAEGTEVEVELTVGDTRYRVTRRRDNNASTATLHANDEPIATGANPVTEEMSHVLGMDAQGFRLATFAQQKELAGLGSLQPHKRAEMLSRLLRVDALDRAAERARRRFNEQREGARAIADVDVGAAERAVRDARDTLEGITRARQRSEQALADVDRAIADAGDVERRWNEAQQARARAEGEEAAARSRLDDAERELAACQVPDEVTPPPRDPDTVAADLAEVDRDLARAEQTAEQARRRQRVAAEVDRVEQRLASVVAEQARICDGDPDDCERRLVADIVAAKERVDAADAAAAAAEEERAAAATAAGRADADAERAAHRLADLDTLEGTCERCGQPVPPEHRDAERERARVEHAEKTAAAEAARVEVERARASRDAYREEAAAYRSELESARAASERYERLRIDAEELRRTWEAQRRERDELPAQEPDVDALRARREALAAELADARDRVERAAARQRAVERRDELARRVTAARDELARAEKAAEQARPDATLEQQWEQHRERLEARAAEQEALQHLSTDEAVARERLDRAEAELDQARRQRDDRRRRVARAEIAGDAGRVLAAAEKRLAGRIRPALEAAVTDTLFQLSAGRFERVEVDDDYSVRVADKDELYPLEEFSGGEMDLIALALRLALAEVVAESHGAGGAGFLVLDECFGSQDLERRGLILDGLRQLRGLYPQVFLVFHAPGIEDAVDRVVELHLDDQREELTVTSS